MAGTGARIRDTRKTLPGLRLLEKYAVRCGGGVNHRLGLGDAVLIKDNHVAAAGSVGAALERARAAAPDLPCEVEVDSLEQLDDVLALGAELVLLDNFTVAQTAEAVRRRGARRPCSSRPAGWRSRTPAPTPQTGVDFLAVGALTHSVTALDVGLDLQARDRRADPRFAGVETPPPAVSADRPSSIRTLTPGRLPGRREGAAGDRHGVRTAVRPARAAPRRTPGPVCRARRPPAARSSTSRSRG